MKICVVNASNPRGLNGNDSYTDFRNYDTWEDAKWRSWHSLACSQKSEFFAYNGDNFHRVYEYDGIILLVNDSPELLIPFIRKLKLMKKKVLVGYHEGFGDFNLKASNIGGNFIKNLKRAVVESDGYWNVIPSANNVYESLLGVKSYPCVHGIPYRQWNHNLTIPVENRKGILVATRTFDQRLQRNTLVTLAEANRFAEERNVRVTFVSEIPLEYIYTWKDFNFKNVDVIQGPFPYIEWLKLIAKHRLVVHYDMSHTLGQIVCDAALVDVPCVGGNSENNIIAMSDCTLFGLDCVIQQFYDEIDEIEDDLKKETALENVGKKVRSYFESL